MSPNTFGDFAAGGTLGLVEEVFIRVEITKVIASM